MDICYNTTIDFYCHVKLDYIFKKENKKRGPQMRSPSWLQERLGMVPIFFYSYLFSKAINLLICS